MIPRPHLNKIPGVMPVAKPESHIKDLSTLTRLQLLEIKDREEKLLSNKFKLNKLPDKGKRIKDLYEKVVNELEKRNNIEEAAAMFSELNIASKGHEKLNQLEWEGKFNDDHRNINPLDDVLDSDDESELDPLKIIAQHSMHEKKTVIIPPEPELITLDDIKEIESFNKNSAESVDAELITIDVSEKSDALRQTLEVIKSSGKSNADCSLVTQIRNDIKNDTLNASSKESPTKPALLDPHIHYIVDKVIDRMPEKEKFMPYKTTISNVHHPEKEKIRKKNSHWENTAATPPLIQHNGTKLVTLLDSVEIQTNYLLRLKELHEQQALERLAAKMERMKTRITVPNDEELKTNPAFSSYRVNSTLIEGTHILKEEDENNDVDADEEHGATVTYTVYD